MLNYSVAELRIKFNKHLNIPFSDMNTIWLKRYGQS